MIKNSATLVIVSVLPFNNLETSTDNARNDNTKSTTYEIIKVLEELSIVLIPMAIISSNDLNVFFLLIINSIATEKKII